MSNLEFPTEPKFEPKFELNKLLLNARDCACGLSGGGVAVVPDTGELVGCVLDGVGLTRDVGKGPARSDGISSPTTVGMSRYFKRSRERTKSVPDPNVGMTASAFSPSVTSHSQPEDIMPLAELTSSSVR